MVFFGGNEWLPVLDGGPTTSTAVFNGAFSGQATSTRGDVSLLAGSGEIDAWSNYAWANRSVKIWQAEIDTSNPSQPVYPTTRTLLFDGDATTFDPDEATLFLETRTPAGKVASGTYLGIGGLEGTTQIKGVVKPFAAGVLKNREATLINAGKLLFQVHAYGAIETLTQVRERGIPLDQPMTYHASFAALEAATVPPTQIHVHLGSGTFRVGFEPSGQVTADFIGVNRGSSATKIGEVIEELLFKAGWDMAKIDTASLDALSTANPGPVQYFDNAGEDILQALTTILTGAGGYWDVDELGFFYVGVMQKAADADFSIGDEGLGDYDLAGIDLLPARAPFWRVRLGYDQNPMVMDYTAVGDVIETHDAIGDQVVQATAEGVAKAGQLPRELRFKRRRGSADVTAAATWSVLPTTGITAALTTQTADGQGVSISAMSAADTSELRVQSVLGSVTVVSTVKFRKEKAAAVSPAPPTGTSYGSMATADVSAVVTATSYGSAYAQSRLTLATGQSLKLSAPLTAQGTDVENDTLNGKWQYSPAGADTWTDAGMEIPGFPGSREADYDVAEVYNKNKPAQLANSYSEIIPGFLDCSQTKAGLSAGDYDVRLMLRRGLGAGPSITVYGQATMKAEA